MERLADIRRASPGAISREKPVLRAGLPGAPGGPIGGRLLQVARLQVQRGRDAGEARSVLEENGRTDVSICFHNGDETETGGQQASSSWTWERVEMACRDVEYG